MFCKDCGAQIEEGAKFYPNCGRAVNINPVRTEAAPPDGNGANQVQKKSDKIDKAVFYHLGRQTYACYLYKTVALLGI
jgi:uncharacterized membrane protein YvbJ